MKQITIDALGGAVLNLTPIKGNLIIGNITYQFKKFHINYWMSKPDELEISDNLQIIEKWRVDKRCSKIPIANYLLSSGIMTYTNNAEYDEAKKNAITLLDCSECKKHFSEITKDN